METNHRINSIDIARLFAAILVIAIHTQAIMWFSDRANGLRFAAPSMSKAAFQATAIHRSKRRWPSVAGFILAECRARSQR